MRPVKRGDSPQNTDFTNYQDAKPFLVNRIGQYCSYCERRIATNLAVEHIQPKGLPAYAALEGCWHNFLLGCVNCNSNKRDKDLVLSDTLLPDRDNTFVAFDYSADGRIELSAQVPLAKHTMAKNLLTLVGLDKPISVHLDENGKQVALDRVAQRMEAWGIALSAKEDIDADPDNKILRKWVIETALGHGFFSIWMNVFARNLDMRKRLIEAFPGTQGSGCFDPISTQIVRPAPNPDQLQNGAKL